MKFKANSKFDSIWFGIISGIIIVLLITSLIIYVNSEDYSVWDHYKYFFDSDDFSILLRARVLLSIKGGAIAVLPVFYLFINKKMYKAVKGLMGVVALLAILAVYGYIA